MNYQKNQILTVDVLETNMMGFGVAKENGAVIFIQNAVQGDRAEIRIIKCAKNYYVARIERLIQPSDFRTEPLCAQHKRCGGCAFQHVTYEHELEVKKKYVKDCIAKAGLDELEVNDILSTGNIEEYRNKAQYPLSLNSDGKVVAGFFEKKSHKVCPIERCSIQDGSFAPIVSFICAYMNQHQILPYHEETDTGLVRHIYLRKAKKTGETMLCLVLKKDCFPNREDFISKITKAFPDLTSIVWNINPKQTNVILGKESKVVWGSEKIREILCEMKFDLSPHSFFQVNRDGAELLYQTAFDLAKIEKYDLILDLYCGIGSISLSTKADCEILGVEIVSDAVEDANANATLNERSNASFVCGDAADALALLKGRSPKNPLVIVDPPRKGLALELIEDLASHSIPTILYISCGPDTLARDLAHFSKLGYQISNVQPVDMFPRTSHVETVCLLSKIDK